jgi:hypothetical protein
MIYDRAGHRTHPARTSSVVHHQTETFILQTNKFANRGRDQQGTRNQVALDLSDDLFLCFVVRIPPSCRLRRHTGVVVKCLMSSKEEHTPSLEAFDTGVGVKRVVTVLRQTTAGEILIGHARGEPDISPGWLASQRVFDAR